MMKAILFLLITMATACSAAVPHFPDSVLWSEFTLDEANKPIQTTVLCSDSLLRYEPVINTENEGTIRLNTSVTVNGLLKGDVMRQSNKIVSVNCPKTSDIWAEITVDKQTFYIPLIALGISFKLKDKPSSVNQVSITELLSASECEKLGVPPSFLTSLTLLDRSNGPNYLAKLIDHHDVIASDNELSTLGKINTNPVIQMLLVENNHTKILSWEKTKRTGLLSDCQINAENPSYRHRLPGKEKARFAILTSASKQALLNASAQTANTRTYNAKEKVTSTQKLTTVDLDGDGKHEYLLVHTQKQYDDCTDEDEYCVSEQRILFELHSKACRISAELNSDICGYTGF